MTMRFKLLGRTGLRVSEICLGTMTFGEDWGWGAARPECARMLDTFAAAGGNFIDTANVYTGGSSERIVGELIAPNRDEWVLATKYTLSTRAADPNAGGSHRKSLVGSLDASLKRLGTDYVDLLWLHIWDFLTPVEEVMRALDDVVRSGKVLYVGVSDTPAWIVSQAVTLADLRGWSRFVGLQIPYSLVQRTVERELLPMARSLDLTVTAWAPLGGGLLTGRYGSDRPRPGDTRLARTGERGERALSDGNIRIADALNRIAQQRDASASQVAIAWVAAQQERAVIVPIVGARTSEQLEENLGALAITLSPQELAELEQASAVAPGFPHDFRRPDLIYGATRDLIDDHRRG